MDGYAATPAAAGSELRVVGESRAGSPHDSTPGPGEAIAISTGALAPPGVGVAPVEVVEASDGLIALATDLALGDHVRAAGEDLPAGARALTAGAVLGPGELAVASTCGAARLDCVRKPTVSIVVTGDELVAPGKPLGPGQIHESNGIALTALCEQAGARVVGTARSGDTLEATRDSLASALETADLVIASGGVSVGRHDHVRPALEALGVEEMFAGVALKPGGPTWCGRQGDGRLVFGLPGNPASAFVTFALFVAPAIRSMLGRSPIPEAWPAALAESVRQRPREQAIRVSLEPRPDGPPRAVSTGAQGSHRTASLSGAWGLAFIPPGEGDLVAGSVVAVEPL
jgi:molybdopterin molybdotransferase